MPSQPPDPYVRQFDFTNHAQTQPTVPLPGDKVDLELNEVRESLNDTIDRLGELQADDGKLRASAVPGDINQKVAAAEAARSDAVAAKVDAIAAKDQSVIIQSAIQGIANTQLQLAQQAVDTASAAANQAQGFASDAEGHANAADFDRIAAQAAATTATTQATTATTQAGLALTRANAAQGHATSADASADAAALSATAAAQSAIDAEASAQAAEAAADSVTGIGVVRYDTAQTIDPMAKALARGNIGLGTAATENTSAFAAAVHTHVHGDVTDLPQGVAYALGIGGGSAANGGSALAGTPGTDKVVGFNGLYAAWVPAGDRYATSSTTSLSVGTGSRTLTVGTGLAYTSQQSVTIAYDASNHMHGEVTSYDSATGVLVVDVKQKTGSGTYAAWSVNVGGISSIATWGQITGTLSSQTDLQSALDGKAASSHTHTASAITDFNTAADARVNALVPAASTTVAGKVELATATEAIAATSTTLAATPDDLFWNRATPGMGLLLGTNSNALTAGTGAASNASMFGITCFGPDPGVVGYGGRRFQMNNGGVGSLEREWGVVDFDRRITLSFRIAAHIVSSGSPNNDSVINVNYGDLLGTDVGGTLARKGFGIQIYGHNNPLRLTVHDGTTYRTVDSSYTPTSSTTPAAMDFMLVSEAGTVTLYQRTTRTGGWSQIATSANGPTGLSAANASSVTFTSRNESINVTTVRWRCLAGFFTVEY